ncbi:RNA polymerase sigma factor [Pedobacter aquatilis]|uniref:RNA polymerase sigma factor n=1 Tax=Pedobacter aquatilis TaxID=351343 RepID=UPI0025B43A50|nr:RNA polymerase sigma factor [Pedobacter aquatilis]MDN3586002.1 RNA polymerase sigma factor [Pedobacter aquatilis]
MKTNEFAIAAKRVEAMLFSHALGFTRDSDDAKDLVQETLLKGFRFCEKFDSSTNLNSWLYVIMRNTFISYYRKEKAKLAVITNEEEITYAQLSSSASSNLAVSGFALGDIQKALKAINPTFSIPFQRYFEGYKYAEIAKELNIPLGTVKTRIHMAREELKKYLKIYRPKN